MLTRSGDERLARTPHRNVLKAEAIIHDRGVVGVVYPFFEQDLHAWCHQHLFLLSWPLVAAVAEGVLGGLSHLHGLDILHRDIKPGNTLVGPSPYGIRIVIADFGWCRMAPDEKNPVEMTPGAVTVPYRAPEIELGCNYSFPADLWSVGIMLAELSEGKTFAPQTGQSKKPQRDLLIAIDGLSGPICEDVWPGINDLAVWRHRGDDVTSARKGKDRCPHPFVPSRRRVHVAARELTDALLMLRPEKRCSTKVGHAQAKKFLSDVAPRHVARSTDPHIGRQMNAAPQVSSRDDVGQRLDAATQTRHVSRRISSKRPLGLVSNFHATVRRWRHGAFSEEKGAVAAATAAVAATATASQKEPASAEVLDENGVTPPSRRVSAMLHQGMSPAAQEQSVNATPRKVPPGLAEQSTVGFRCRGPVATTAASESPSDSVSPLHRKWETSLTRLPDPPEYKKNTDKTRCQCTGRCSIDKSRAHSRVTGGGRSECHFVSVEGSKFCDLCRCRVPGCSGSQVFGATCRKLDHLFAPLDESLKALVFLKAPLAEMDPIDLRAFLTHAPDVKDDILLLSILADVWEPVPVERLSKSFASLPASYKAEDVAKAYEDALDTITYGPDDECTKHKEVLNVGGMCRHFGFHTVGKRLGLIRDVDADAPELGTKKKKSSSRKKHSGYEYVGSTDILKKLVAHKREHPMVMTRAWKKARTGKPEDCVKELKSWVHHRAVPKEMSWGYQDSSYHGSHIWRKIWLLMYHSVGEDKWSLPTNFVIEAGPDVGAHVTKLPSALSSPVKLKRAFAPTDITRIHMWTCLLHICFKQVKGFRSAWEAGRVTVELWEQARQEVTRERHFTPHPLWVAERVLLLLEATS